MDLSGKQTDESNRWCSYAPGSFKFLERVEGSVVFHAGTAMQGDDIVTNGGRVLAVTSLGTDAESALNSSYKNIQKISFEGNYFRKDIGFDL